MENPKGDSPRKTQRGGAPMGTRTLLAIGLAAAVLIGIGAVFLASGGPDGLESAALVVHGEKSLTGPAPADAEVKAPGLEGASYVPPFPDYTVGIGSGRAGSIIAIVLGIALTFGAILGITRLLRHRRREENQE
jgi:cobalt/nickel transport protein